MATKEELEQKLTAMPGMVRWFSPLVLLQTARQALDSALFGQYADRRLMQAALDPLSSDVAARYDLSQSVKPDGDGAVWVDFVADLGDGFDPTYAIAYLLSRPQLSIGEHTLPRASVLVMGGDQVYPAASKHHYDARMKEPYEWAFPRPANSATERPKLFLIPGNHDWYDGLVLFLAKFCRGRTTPFGCWQATQHRSYFALQLPGNWWIWGIDVQLSEDIDAPQADYFATIARAMQPDAKIILCSAVPSWLIADESDHPTLYRSLDYIAGIARDECTNARICVVLSGDVHHYSRYSANEAGTQFITAGGGGAFLHPTHNLRDTIAAKWIRKPQVLSLRTRPEDPSQPSPTAACYPSREQSRSMLWGNLAFWWNNWEFSVALGLVYWILSLAILVWRPEIAQAVPMLIAGGDVALQSWLLHATLDNPMFWLVAAVLLAALYRYADAKTLWGRFSLGLSHSVLHLLLLVALTLALPIVLIGWWGLTSGGALNWLATLLGFVMSGFGGAFIFGIYLLLTCLIGHRHCNDAFSAMRSGRYKNFVRMRIKGDEIKLFAIGLDAPPLRSEWRVNPRIQPGDSTVPVIVPESELQPRLIEGPIIVAASHIAPIGKIGKGTEARAAAPTTPD